MATPVDLEVWRGDDQPPQAWLFPAGVTLGGSVYELSVFKGTAELLFLSSEDGGLTFDNEARLVIWPVSRAQSLMIPPRRVAEYKLRRVLLGSRQTLAYGTINGLGGNEADV